MSRDLRCRALSSQRAVMAGWGGDRSAVGGGFAVLGGGGTASRPASAPANENGSHLFALSAGSPPVGWPMFGKACGSGRATPPAAVRGPPASPGPAPSSPPGPAPSAPSSEPARAKKKQTPFRRHGRLPPRSGIGLRHEHVVPWRHPFPSPGRGLGVRIPESALDGDPELSEINNCPGGGKKRAVPKALPPKALGTAQVPLCCCRNRKSALA